MAYKATLLFVALAFLALASADPIRRKKVKEPFDDGKCHDCNDSPTTVAPPPSNNDTDCTTPPPENPCDNGGTGPTCRPPDHNCPDRPYNPVGKCGHNESCNCWVNFLPDRDYCDVFYMCNHGKPIQMCCPPDLCFDTKRPKSPSGKCPSKDGSMPVYLPDDNDCHIFYECSAGTPVEKECLPELCFDPVLNVCAYPDQKLVVAPLAAEGTCPPRDTNETIYLRDDQNCTLYYICSNGFAIQRECPPDMSWNQEKHICDWDIDANCDLGKKISALTAVGECPAKDGQYPVYLPDDEKDNIYYECSNGVAVKNECPGELVFNPVLNICDFKQDTRKSVKPLSAVGECPAKDGQFPVYLPDDEKDNIYYECSNGVAVKNECPGELVFNPVLNICDFKQDTRKSVKPLSAVGECPEKDGQFPVFLPDDEKDDIYYECSNGVAIQNWCTANLKWDQELKTCVFRTKISPMSAVGECPAKDGQYPVYLPDDEKDNIYYECSNGVAVKNECPGELVFNPVLNICDFKQDTRKSVKPLSAVGECPEKDGQFPVFLPDDEKDDIYYECSNGVAIQNWCTANLKWDQELKTCVFRTKISPKSAVGECPEKDGQFPVFLPDDEKDDIYYECSNGVAIQNWCTANLKWDQELKTCVFRTETSFYDAVGKCPARDGNETVFLPDATNCTVYYICSNGRPIKASCTPGMAWNPKLNICDWEIDVDCPAPQKSVRSAVGKCPSTDPANPVYLPDSESCKLYYECSNGIAVQNECPPDLEFNPVLHVCDDPWNAGCKAGGDQPSTTEDQTNPTTLDYATTA